MSCRRCGKTQWGSNACHYQNRCNGFGGPMWQSPSQDELEQSEIEDELRRREQEMKDEQKAARQAKIDKWNKEHRVSVKFACPKCGKKPDDVVLCSQPGGCLDTLFQKTQEERNAFLVADFK